MKNENSNTIIYDHFLVGNQFIVYSYISLNRITLKLFDGIYKIDKYLKRCSLNWCS